MKESYVARGVSGGREAWTEGERYEVEDERDEEDGEDGLSS